MWIHLYCSSCSCLFSALADTPASQVLDRMTDDAPWFALAEGDTFEEMVSAALQRRGKLICPECREEIQVLHDAQKPLQHESGVRCEEPLSAQ